jgi:hypothetical protein
MNRLVSAVFAEAIGEALAVIPEPVVERLRHVHFLTGTDPLFAGLHTYAVAEDGRSFGDTAHCSYAHNSADRTTTIVIPVPLEPHLIVHELGHALDEALNWAHRVVPVTDYARVNRYEGFAESFVAWLYWYGDQDAFLGDRATRALFDRLAA